MRGLFGEKGRGHFETFANLIERIGASIAQSCRDFSGRDLPALSDLQLCVQLRDGQASDVFPGQAAFAEGKGDCSPVDGDWLPVAA